jgi:virginiamycin B lyase
MRRVVTLLLLALALPAGASAAPALDREIPVSGKPLQLVQGPDGNVWFGLETSSTNDEFGRIMPDGTVDEFDTPGAEKATDIAAGGGRVWMAYEDGIIEVDPADPENPVVHPVSEVNTSRSLAFEPADGDLWVVDDFSGSVVEIGDDGTFKREIPGESLAGGTPSGRGIAAGSDGRMWWMDFGQVAVQATNPATGTSKAFPISGGNPQEIATGPAGELGFTSPQDIIGRIATADGAIRETSNPLGDATGLVLANDGAYWSAEFNKDSLARLAPDGTLTHPIQFSSDADPRHITTGAGDTLWVSLEDLGAVTGPRIARITGVSAPPPPDPKPVTPEPQPACCAPPPPPPPPPDTTRPVVGPLSMRPAAFRAGRGSTISATLSEAASILVRVERAQSGRRKAGRCVAPRRARRGSRCKRYVAVGTFTRTAVAGRNAIVFRGRVGGRRLKPGAYRLTLVATDAAGNASTPRRLLFRIVKPRART